MIMVTIIVNGNHLSNIDLCQLAIIDQFQEMGITCYEFAQVIKLYKQPNH